MKGALVRYARAIDAATPAGRDRTVDALRALAIAGVILGHWLVTALVVTRSPAGAGLHDTSPLASHPALAPVSWIFQTLAIFFFVGGYSASKSFKGSYPSWLRARLARLGRPVLVLAAVWVPLTIAMILAGVRASAIHTIVWLVLSPLWFLGVFAGLTALTPLAVALVRRLGAAAALVPAAVVAGVDAARFGLGGPAWLGWVNVGAGWLVPYLLGIAWARGAFRGWKVPAALLAAGAGATAALVAWAGYPASMVGVNGAAHLEPEPAHAGRRHLRRGAGRPGATAAARAGPGHAPPAGLGAGRAGQPVGHDPVPLAPVGVPGRDHDRVTDRPAARPAHPADRGLVDRGAAGLAARLRGCAGPRVAGIPPRRAIPAPAREPPQRRRAAGGRRAWPARPAGCRAARRPGRSALSRLEPLQQRLVLIPQRVRQVTAERGEVLPGMVGLVLPGAGVHREQQLQVRVADRQAAGVQGVLGAAGCRSRWPAPRPSPFSRSVIHFRTRLFSPNPGQANLPSAFLRNQFTA